MSENDKGITVHLTVKNIAIFAVIVAIVFGIIAWYYADRADKLQNEMSNILKPSITKTDINVEGGTTGYLFYIYINNPSDTQYFIDFTNSFFFMIHDLW